MKPYSVDVEREVTELTTMLTSLKANPARYAETIAVGANILASIAIAERLERIAELLELIAGQTGTKIKP